MTVRSQPAARDWLLFRASQRRVHGGALPDELVVTWSCRRCGEEALAIEHQSQQSVPYREIEGLVAAATLAAVALARNASACLTCQGQRTATQIDYHCSHSVAGCDLVVRWRPKKTLLGRSRVELLWWDADLGYQRTAMLSDEEAQTIERDAVLRALRLAWETGGMEAALPALEEAAERFPSDSALMDLVPALYAAGRDVLARTIVMARAELALDDADAAYWAGFLILQDVARGVWPLETLADAENSLERALSLRADFPEAEIACAQAAKLRGRVDLSRLHLECVLRRHDGHLGAIAALGALELLSDPRAAHETFARGLVIAPRDPDCARGAALALTLLGRTHEAVSPRAQAGDPLAADVAR
jgi:tetratricopeptide (TPR) repeat protein